LKGHDASLINGGISIEHGLNIVPQILELRPDAVICGNDRVAIGVEIGLLKAGIRIPQDIMVTGADNIELSQYCPVPLSTFDWMSRQCGSKCVEIMMAHLHDKAPLCSALVQPEVIIRQSA
ncbi:MAG: substrate-binding domain-containing protein, partial [Victivallaceae bacterium]